MDVLGTAARWYDSLELWVAGLAFPFQAAVVLMVVVPACAGVAWCLDRAVCALPRSGWTVAVDSEPVLPNATAETEEAA